MELYDIPAAPNTGLQIIGAGLNPDDLWRNVFWLRDRVTALEARVRACEAEKGDQ